MIYNAQTTYYTVDTVVWLKAGEYAVTHYTTYSDKKARTVLEAASVADGARFTVADNELTEEVYITLNINFCSLLG